MGTARGSSRVRPSAWNQAVDVNKAFKQGQKQKKQGQEQRN